MNWIWSDWHHFMHCQVLKLTMHALEYGFFRANEVEILTDTLSNACKSLTKLEDAWNEKYEKERAYFGETNRLAKAMTVIDSNPWNRGDTLREDLSTDLREESTVSGAQSNPNRGFSGIKDGSGSLSNPHRGNVFREETDFANMSRAIIKRNSFSNKYINTNSNSNE